MSTSMPFPRQKLIILKRSSSQGRSSVVGAPQEELRSLCCHTDLCRELAGELWVLCGGVGEMGSRKRTSIKATQSGQAGTGHARVTQTMSYEIIVLNTAQRTLHADQVPVF